MAFQLPPNCHPPGQHPRHAEHQQTRCSKLNGGPREVLARLCASRCGAAALTRGRAWQAGFTLIELMVVIAIIAIATAGVTLALRDPSETQLEREAQRLAALLESARARSRASGAPVRWLATPGGFRFEGLPKDTLPQKWLSSDVAADPGAALLLGPEPIIGPQSVVLRAAGTKARALMVATDGLRPFAVVAATQQP